MTVLKLVPQAILSPKQAVIERVKQMRSPGLLQCPLCGSRTSLLIRNGDRIRNNRIMPGTVIAKHVCADCYVGSRVQVSMLPPDLKPVT
jgi:transposase